MPSQTLTTDTASGHARLPEGRCHTVYEACMACLSPDPPGVMDPGQQGMSTLTAAPCPVFSARAVPP
ncbi:hypothetical protein ACFRCW_31605 [Streptomyces sp. NPDC056653]|uniref:hypothetical protein n=1 Tax=Streptomyces sp. NPDC056653 TaxID=3345894 RepID=UPI003698E0D2